jgi:hypothetical protein
MGATFFGEIEYEECSAYDNKGKIDCVINWTFDDYDANGCSPQEKIKTEIVDSKTKEIHTLCACKEGYKRVEGGCKFIPPKGIKLENKEQETATEVVTEDVTEDIEKVQQVQEVISLEQKLAELKSLFDRKLISEEEYIKARKAALNIK